MSLATIKSELDKCDLLCGNCHREEHEGLAEKSRKPVDPGTPNPEGPKCAKCNIRKTEGSFPLDYRGNRSSWCKGCTATYQRAYRGTVKQEIVNYKGGCCEKCGYKKSMAAFDFHHPDPTQKDFGIGELRDKRLSVVKNEVDKCLMLCVNCHREIHEFLNIGGSGEI